MRVCGWGRGVLIELILSRQVIYACLPATLYSWNSVSLQPCPVKVHFLGNHIFDFTCRMRDTAVVRASDDFYPRNEASSHPHVAACAFNSVFIGALAQPDWDMFHSQHPAALLHATARQAFPPPCWMLYVFVDRGGGWCYDVDTNSVREGATSDTTSTISLSDAMPVTTPQLSSLVLLAAPYRFKASSNSVHH